MTKCFTTLEVERYKLGTLMAKYVLSKSTVHARQLEEIQLIVGDYEILLKKKIKKILENIQKFSQK